MKNSAEKIAMKSYEDIFKPTSLEMKQVNVNTLPLDQLRPFKHHPFRIYNEEKIKEMVESIKENGILMPILVRPLADAWFEIISGHNRVEAAKRAGLTDIPASPLVGTQIDNVSSGAIMAGINVSKLKGIEVQIPPFPLQIRFANICEHIGKFKLEMEKGLSELASSIEHYKLSSSPDAAHEVHHPVIDIPEAP